jgi:asparagine synthase (glutamine-hydrolysing)
LGGFFYGVKQHGDGCERIRKASRRAFASSGLGPPLAFDTDTFFVDYYPKKNSSTANVVQFPTGDFVLAVGTFMYDGEIGERALKRFYAVSDHQEALRTCRGHFTVILRKAGETRLLQDLGGSSEVFLIRGLSYVTSSFLAALTATERNCGSRHEVYEYVFNGVTLGNTTVIEDIRRLEFFEHLILGPFPSRAFAFRNICPPEATESESELANANLGPLLRYTSELVGHFGDDISVALSGGYDSRLLVGLFRHCGAKPRVFVYGSDLHSDVAVAKRIAAAEKFELHHVDKTRCRKITLDRYPEIVQSNFLADDALPSDGIFVNGAELDARQERNRGGALHVNGGGGEVFRNFFNLMNRALTPREFVWIFYSRYDVSECTQEFDPRDYEERIAGKVVALFKPQSDILSRRQVESLYPYFRCRSWFGHENSVNNRWGHSVLPFYDFQTVDQALRVPIRYKYFGDFESRLIRLADPSLARHLSNYGHDFSGNAPMKRRVADFLTYARPPRARRESFRLRNRLLGQSRSHHLTREYLERVIDVRFPHMSRYFKVDEVRSELHFSRICTLEYLFNEISAQ